MFASTRYRLTLSALLLTGLLTAMGCNGSSGASSSTTTTTVQVWLSTADSTSQLSRQSDLAMTQKSASSSATVVTINAAKTYQEVVGFGAALTDASAILIHGLSDTQRSALLKELFGRDNSGLGLGFTRLTIGASDFSTSHYSLDDQPAGSTDPSLAGFSIAPERTHVLPVLKEMLAVNSSLKVMASPWSAPGWMKSSDSLIKGSLLPSAYSAFAQYLRLYVDALATEGVTIYAITLQNEPNYEPDDYPGMLVTADSRAAFIGGYLGPLFLSTHPDVRILDWDHNWDLPSSPLTVLADSVAAPYVAGVAWHCYAGEPSAQGTVHNTYPAKETWFTECSGGEWVADSEALATTAGALANTMRYWSKGALLWNLALDENHGPHLGGCTNCRGVVTINSTTGAITRTVDYYALGHFSRFVLSGAVRIEAGDPITNLDTVAFLNTDGSRVLVAVNRASVAKSFFVSEGSSGFTYSLPAGGVATFVWR